MTHPINRVEDMLGIPVYHTCDANKPLCGADSVRVTSITENVTCRECLELELKQVEEDMRGNPISYTYHARRQWILKRLGYDSSNKSS